MTKIDLFSGFLGAGKTTLIKKLIQEGFQGEKLVLIENEFGEIGIDGGFLQEAGITVNEMNSGCICCSLVGDFTVALKQVLDQYAPDRILIEPSGVGKLSDVIRAVQELHDDRVVLNSCCTVVDAKKCKLYMKNFGEFFNDQIEHAGVLMVSHTSGLSSEELQACVSLLQAKNSKAAIVTTPWDQLTALQIIAAMEHSLEHELRELTQEIQEHHHGHECRCQEHHQHDRECDCHHHEHEHACDCGDHHHADQVFDSFGRETVRRFTTQEIQHALASLEESNYGMVLRAKGIVQGEDDIWIHFDYTPGEVDVRSGGPSVTGRLCVIGTGLQPKALEELFHI